MSLSTNVPKIALAETLKTWLVPAESTLVMRAAIVMQRAEAIQKDSLKLGRNLKAVASTVLALSDIDLMGQWYLGVTANAALYRTRHERVILGDSDESIR